MKVERVITPAADRPLCVATVRIAGDRFTTTAQMRVYDNQRRGLPVDQCARRASHLVDGRPLCTAHAGVTALAHLIQKEAR